MNIKRHVPERIPTAYPTVVIEVTLQDGEVRACGASGSPSPRSRIRRP